MNNTLSLALIDVVFDLLNPIGIVTYQIELSQPSMQLLQTLMINEQKGSIFHMSIHEFNDCDVVIKKDGTTITFTLKK